MHDPIFKFDIHFVQLYITYNMVKFETNMRVELDDTRLYLR